MSRVPLSSPAQVFFWQKDNYVFLFQSKEPLLSALENSTGHSSWVSLEDGLRLRQNWKNRRNESYLEK
jgi:hypothetical protein